MPIIDAQQECVRLGRRLTTVSYETRSDPNHSFYLQLLAEPFVTPGMAKYIRAHTWSLPIKPYHRTTILRRPHRNLPYPFFCTRSLGQRETKDALFEGAINRFLVYRAGKGDYPLKPTI